MQKVEMKARNKLLDTKDCPSAFEHWQDIEYEKTVTSELRQRLETNHRTLKEMAKQIKDQQ